MDAPTYLIKSRSGEVLIQGTAEQVAGWVKEQRVSDKDEFQRQGWLLYEKDDAWSVIESFPELYGPSGWVRLKVLRRRNYLILGAAFLFALIGFVLISASQLMPAYDASQRIAASKASEDAANFRSLEAKSAQVKAEQLAKAAAEAAGLDREKAKSAEVRLEGEISKTRDAQSQVTKLEKRLDEIKKTMPIVVRWRESLINSNQVLVVSSSSVRPLKLLVSIYDANGVQTREQYPLNLEPVGANGSTKESGIGESVKHYFKNGESAEFTDVDATKDFRYNPRKYVSP
jgi:hypothetical protein